MKRMAIACILVLLLVGCAFTPEGRILRQVLIEKGAVGYDALLEDAELIMCRVASVGAVKRRYGQTQASADAWRAICEGQDGVELIGPDE